MEGAEPSPDVLGRWREDAFHTDLGRLAKERRAVVLLIDDFEHASAEVKDWLQGWFLPWVAETWLPNLVVVIAGRSTPEVGKELAGLAIALELGPLPPEAVREFLATTGAPQGIDAEALYKLSEGRPDLLMQLLSRAGADSRSLG